MMNLEVDAATIQAWVPAIIQLLATVGAIFGGVGYWQWKQAKDQAKRDEAAKKNGSEGKIDKLTEQVTELSSKFDTKFDGVVKDLREIKSDVVLLQKANEETVKYRELRDANDKKAMIAQQAVIVSLKGLLRERLLDNYNKCMAKGYYTKEERETYGEMFKCYESEPFDGNGVMHQLQPIMQELPWTAEGAAQKNNKDKK